MTTGVVLLNFGEPPEPTRDVVVPYLERIFYDNRFIEGDAPEAVARERSRELAERRAPGLIEEYESIGGSPLNEQANAQVEAVEAGLSERGFDVAAYLGTQFAEPTIAEAVAAAREDGVDRLVGLPVYPLCGPSTTVAALEDLEVAVEEADWDVPIDEITGWHRSPRYAGLRADNVRRYAVAAGVDLADPETRLVFSAHGTPTHYLDEGSRYDRYVEEYTATQAALLGVETYDVGYQNHENRDIPWTEPAVEDVVAGADADRVVVEPVSFVHEQSETLSELDEELRTVAEDAGLEFYRVPVPHDDPALTDLFCDLVVPFLAGVDPAQYQLRPCECASGDAVCLNAPRGDRP